MTNHFIIKKKLFFFLDTDLLPKEGPNNYVVRESRKMTIPLFYKQLQLYYIVIKETHEVLLYNKTLFSVFVILSYILNNAI